MIIILCSPIVLNKYSKYYLLLMFSAVGKKSIIYRLYSESVFSTKRYSFSTNCFCKYLIILYYVSLVIHHFFYYQQKQLQSHSIWMNWTLHTQPDRLL